MYNGQWAWHRPILLSLTIWLSSVGSMILIYLLTVLTKQSPISIIILSFFRVQWVTYHWAYLVLNSWL